MTATDSSSASAIRRLESLFENVKLEEKEDVSSKKHLPGKRNSGQYFETTIIEERVNKKCDIHGRESRKSDYGPRRGSMGNVSHIHRRPSTGIGMRRDSMPALHVIHNHPPIIRRDSGGLGIPPSKSQDLLIHPSSFPSSLRKSSVSVSTSNLRRDSMGASVGNLRGNLRRDSNSSVGSGKNGTVGRRDSFGRRFSTDSLELMRRNSWDRSRRESTSSSGLDESIFDGGINGRVSF